MYTVRTFYYRSNNVSCMHILNKKIATGLIAASIMMPFVAFADTTDLQGQIQSLLNQIHALQQQLVTLVASSSNTGAGVWMNASTTLAFGMPPGQGSKAGCIALTRNLGRGAHGDDVKQLQQVLKDDPDSGFGGSITGFFGALTARAMANFQMHMGIASSSTGTVGPLTRVFFERKCGQGGGGGGAPFMRGQGVSGTITANSGANVTIQSSNGTSTVVNITASTTITVINGTSTPPTTGSVSDLVVGKVAAADGPRNPDGSIQAVHVMVGMLPPPMMGGDDHAGEHGMIPPPAPAAPPGGHCGGFRRNWRGERCPPTRSKMGS